MKFTVLGKYGEIPSRNGGNSSYLVETDRAKILLECGSGALSRLQNYCKIEELDAIILSHLHSDHISDMLPLRYYLERNKLKIPVYMPLVKGSEYELITSCDGFVLNPIIEGISATVDDVALKFYRVKHRVETYAIRLESGGRNLVFSGDAEMCSGLSRALVGAHAFLADCAIPTVLHGDHFSHMSVSEGVALAKPSGIKLYITHHFAGMSVKLEAKQLYDKAVVVEEKKTYLV